VQKNDSQYAYTYLNSVIYIFQINAFSYHFRYIKRMGFLDHLRITTFNYYHLIAENKTIINPKSHL